MLDHFGFNVSNLDKSVAFYENSLRPLGLQIIERHDYGAVIIAKSSEESIPFIWIGTAVPSFHKGELKIGGTPLHYCFTAPTKEAVDEFYKMAMEFGGTCNGPAGPRGDDYYAAYVLDPDGNNIEASVRL